MQKIAPMTGPVEVAADQEDVGNLIVPVRLMLTSAGPPASATKSVRRLPRQAHDLSIRATTLRSRMYPTPAIEENNTNRNPESSPLLPGSRSSPDRARNPT